MRKPAASTRIRFTQPCRVEKDDVVFDLDLEPRGEWQTCVLVALHADDDERVPLAEAHDFGQTERQAGQVLQKWQDEVPRLRAADVLEHVYRRSVVDLACRLRAAPSAEEVNAAVKSAAEGPLSRIVEYSEVPLVSSDIIGNPHSSIFDALSTASSRDGFLKVVAWYDNEWGYSNRVVDLIDRLAGLGFPP